MFDKLSIIADELAQTGDFIPATADDGSDEWNTCSPAYERAVQSVTQAHNWNFETNVVTLNRVGDSPDDMFEDAYAKPNGALSIVWVRVNGMPANYTIINNQIVLTAAGGIITCKYTIDAGPANWPPMFADIIRLHVRAAIYRGLHEDPAQADREEGKAHLVLLQAQTRVDQDTPKRALFNGRAQSARFVRRPYIRMPPGWGGTGIPS
jgi:hypothetical protein